VSHIVLVRPGSTDYDEQGRISGNLDIPLCHSGAGQVARIVSELKDVKLSVVYAAPDQASQQTAAAIAAAHDAKVKTLDSLLNLDMGLWQGKLIEDVRTKQKKVYRQWQENPETVCPPEGETLAEAIQRTAPAIDKVVRKAKGGSVALVVPEPLCSVVRRQLTNESIGDLWAADSICGSWETIDTEALANLHP
jgi:broad specificity phosphatase PhoE